MCTVNNICATELMAPPVFCYRTILAVWKTLLEETERVAKARLQAAETYMQNISEPVKPIKTSKALVAKKVCSDRKHDVILCSTKRSFVVLLVPELV